MEAVLFSQRYQIWVTSGFDRIVSSPLVVHMSWEVGYVLHHHSHGGTCEQFQRLEGSGYLYSDEHNY